MCTWRNKECSLVLLLEWLVKLALLSYWQLCVMCVRLCPQVFRFWLH